MAGECSRVGASGWGSSIFRDRSEAGGKGGQSADTGDLVSQGCGMKNHALGGLEHALAPSSAGQEPEIRVSAGPWDAGPSRGGCFPLRPASDGPRPPLLCCGFISVPASGFVGPDPSGLSWCPSSVPVPVSKFLLFMRTPVVMD